MPSVIILQARTSSTRLPAKVMLPIKGLPLVVLAAKRAANTGRELVVVTSNMPSDDGLAALLKNNDLNYCRGSLENTLNRTVQALHHYDDQTIVFRLTADNVFPDGALIDEIEHDFLIRKLEYLSCNGEPSGLPYGMSVEVTRLGHLREADIKSTSSFDQEHVTPYIRRAFGEAFFEKYKNTKMGHYRCTVDCLDDYLNVEHIFSNESDPIQVSAFELIDRLKKSPSQPVCKSPVSKLVVGAAQFGSHYGIANITGKPTALDAQALIKAAITNGVKYLDTARAYGDSESVIGGALKGGWEGRVRVITKLSPLQHFDKGTPISTLCAAVDASIYQSCSSLGVKVVDVLLLHRASHLADWGGAVWNRLLELKAQGVIGELGVSVQNPEELANVLRDENVAYIQLPFNLLDWRWDTLIPKVEAIKKIRPLTIHVRSVLLQGLLPSTQDRLWKRANASEPSVIADWLLKQVNITSKLNVVDLCLSYVNSMSWIDGLVTGMESMSQLMENIQYFDSEPINQSQLEQIKTTRPKLTEATLNPSLWRN